MPHAGGGSGGGGGGFHSSSSGTSSSVPRFDAYGRPHSHYYVRPGFYYHHTYVSYSRNGRLKTAITPAIISILFLLVIFTIISFATMGKPSYNEESLEDYGIEAYEEVYDEYAKSYEYNILVVIVCYEDLQSYDYISIVGDYIDYDVDLMFGNQKTRFGHEINTNLIYNDYYNNLYENIAISLENITGYVDVTKYQLNTQQSKLVNKTEHGEINGAGRFNLAEQAFYDKTGYHVSVYVTDAREVYNEPVFFIIAAVVIGVFMTFTIVSLVKNIKAVKFISKKEAEGTVKDYYEGEVDFDTFTKDHPLGSEYTFDPDEYKFDNTNGNNK